MGHLPYQFLYVCDVPYHLRIGNRGIGQEHQDRRLNHRDVDCGRSCSNAADGLDFAVDTSNLGGLHGSAVRLLRYRHLFLPLAKDASGGKPTPARVSSTDTTELNAEDDAVRRLEKDPLAADPFI